MKYFLNIVESLLADLESVSEAVSQMTMTVGATPPELAVQVYNNYNFEHTYNEDLPITAYREQVNLLFLNQVLRSLLYENQKARRLDYNFFPIGSKDAQSFLSDLYLDGISLL